MIAKENIIKTIVVSAFCGTGKTYICKNSDKKFIEYECWKYNDGNFPKNYIDDIKSSLGKVDVIFISTNSVVLNKLISIGIKIILVYPQIGLKHIYLDRYKNRGSSSDFISMISKNWDKWINELSNIECDRHIQLKDGQYIPYELFNNNVNRGE